MRIIKKWATILAISTLLIPHQSMAGIEKLIKNVMPKGTMSNVNKSAIVHDQLSGHIIGGSVIMKSPPIDDLSLINMQAPVCKLGGLPCGAQADLRAGAFSFIKARQLEGFFKDLVTNTPAYISLLAIKSVSPQIENIMTYLEQIQRSVNQFNINGCDAATAIAGGIASKLSKGAELTKQTSNVLSNKGADMAEIRAKSKDDGGDPTSGHPELKSLISDNFNLVWKALDKKLPSGGDSTSLKEMLMSISGTVIGKKDEHNRRYFAHIGSLVSGEMIEQMIGSSGGAGEIELYVCDETTTCLSPIRRKTRLAPKDTLIGSIDTLLGSIIKKVQNNNGAFTEEEENLISLSTIPLINEILMQLSKGGKEGNLAIRLNEFLEVLAFDVATNHLTKMLRQTSEAVAELSNVQLIDSPVFRQFEEEVGKTISFLTNGKAESYRRLNSIEQIKTKMAMEEAEFERKFSLFAQQNHK